jgi:DNA repair exonuclease SbcCD ATPase subunit
MDDQNPSSFSIRIDEESPDSVLEEAPKAKEIKKVNLKIMFSTFFVLCLVAGALFFAYREIEKKTVQLQKTGIDEVAELSKALDTSLASISEKNTKLEQTLSAKISSLTQKIAAMQADMKKKDKAIKELKNSKAGKKTLTRGLNKLGKSIDTMSKDLGKVSTAMQATDRMIKTKLSELNEMVRNVKAELKKIKTEFSGRSSAMIDKQRLDEALENDREYFRLKINQIAASMEEKFSELGEKINKINNSNRKNQAADTTEASSTEGRGLVEENLNK